MLNYVLIITFTLLQSGWISSHVEGRTLMITGTSSLEDCINEAKIQKGIMLNNNDQTFLGYACIKADSIGDLK